MCDAEHRRLCGGRERSAEGNGAQVYCGEFIGTRSHWAICHHPYHSLRILTLVNAWRFESQTALEKPCDGGLKKSKKAASSTVSFHPLKPSETGEDDDDSVEFALRVLIQIEAEGVWWHPVYKFPMQPAASEANEPTHTHLRAAEREIAALKRQLASAQKELQARNEGCEKPTTTRACEEEQQRRVEINLPAIQSGSE